MKPQATFADAIEHLNTGLNFSGQLPSNLKMMNPYQRARVIQLSQAFYRQYYSDQRQRHLILGINPGRHGAGVSGIPFTDSKRLQAYCGIDPGSLATHEVSSVFVYQMIEAYGGCQAFYADFYINSPCPLGLLQLNPKGNWVNCNYYDSPQLIKITARFIQKSMQAYLKMPIYRNCAIVLGCGKNLKVLKKLNQQSVWFDELIGLEHPRYIMQYKSKTKQLYLDKYLTTLRQVAARK